MISLATKRYQSAASSVFAFSKTHDYVLTSFARQIRCEFKEICSLKHNSVLRSGHETMKNFSWEVVWEELNQMTPTLVKFLQKLFPKSNKMFLSCIICLMLKHRCKHMSLLQRVISVLFYGHGTSQQVCV